MKVGYTSMKSREGRVGEQYPCTDSPLVASDEDTDS